MSVVLPTTLYQPTALYAQNISDEKPPTEINLPDNDIVDLENANPEDDPDDIADSNSLDETISAFATVPPQEPMSAATYRQLFDKWLDQQSQALFNQMTENQRVGQLLVITFEGNHEQLEADDVMSELETFIHEYHIGGFAISAYHGNFDNVAAADPANTTSTPLQVALLNTKLQAAAYGWNLSEKQAKAIISGTIPLTQTLQNARRFPISDTTSSDVILSDTALQPLVHVPLFIAAQQDSDGLPNHDNEGPPNVQLLSGFTQQPSQLALGSTWNPNLVRQVGEFVGQELQAVGINMLLGPDLNIVDIPRSDQVGRLGIHSFGGSPYWVGEMGRAYIAGIHRGSAGSIATIAKHFPGQGDVDRLPNLEVATIQRSAEELQQITLDPFRRVTEAPPSPFIPINGPEFTDISESSPNVEIENFNRDEFLPITDGLMSSHMRYSAIQGRVTPLSLSSALQGLLGQESFDGWRQGGGLVMSNVVGVQAIRHHYDPTLTSFRFLPASVAFLTAGNDLLYINRLSNQDAWDANRDNTRFTIDLFRKKYFEDSEFRTEVDESVQRILRLKLRLYGNPSIETLKALEDNRSQESNLDEESENVSEEGQENTLEQDTRVGDNSNAIPGSLALTPSSAKDSNLSLQNDIIPLSDVLIDPQRFTQFQTEAHQTASDDLIRQVARESITLLHKGNEDYVPPRDAQILVFTDSRLVEPCKPACPPGVVLEPENISDIILRLYGPESTKQFRQSQIKSATFVDLINLLDPPQTDGINQAITPTAMPTSTGTTDDLENILSGNTALSLPAVPGASQTPEPDGLETADRQTLARYIRNANWIIVSMLDVDSENHPSSVALKRFLSERGKDVQEKNVVVFGLNGPYFLDATEISKLTAYFGVYSKLQPFQEMAVRALFEGTPLVGAPASSVLGGDYRDLAGRLLPAPDQSIALQLYDQADNLLFDTSLENEEGNTIVVDVDASLTLKTGTILDLNGHPVPNGTKVVFTFDYLEEDGQTESSPSTKQGQALVRLDDRLRVGNLQIVASSGQATSQEIVLKVQQPPTPTATDAPILVPTDTPTPPSLMLTPVLTQTPEIILVPTPISTQTLNQPLITPTITITTPQVTPTVSTENLTSTDIVVTMVIPTETPTATVAPPQTPEPEPATPTLTVLTPAATPSDLIPPPPVDSTTLVAMLSTMLLSLTLFVTATLRVLPRKTLVHHALWAINAGLVAYILYGLKLIPGMEILQQYLNIWTGAIIVLVTMLLTLLWLQSRVQE